MSIRVHGWQPASQNPGSTFFRKNVLFFEIHRTCDTSMGFLFRLFWTAARGPKNPGSTIFRKEKTSFFLNYIGPVTPSWVLYPSEIMLLAFTGHLLARAVFAKSIKILGWQAGAPKSRSKIFRKKNVLFLNFVGLVTPPWVLYPSEIMQLGFAGPLLARTVFAKSIKVLGWQPGAPENREHDFPKKNS